MYTEQDRDTLLAQISEFIAGNPLFEGLVQIGSGAEGYRDIYSDIDLMAGCYDGQDISTAEETLLSMFNSFGSDYIDRRRWSDTVLGLSVYWSNGLSVDLSFMPTIEIPIRSQRWMILLSKTAAFENTVHSSANNLRKQSHFGVDNVVCHKFLYALRRCEIAAKRGEYIFADSMLAEARQHLLTMEAAYCEKDLHQFKAYNSLPSDFLSQLESTYPVCRDVSGIVNAQENMLTMFLTLVDELKDFSFDKTQLSMIGWSEASI